MKPIKTQLIIQNLIASGGMSDVYEALLVQENGFRKKIAAKKLKPELKHKKSILLQEAKIQASLNHPNICTVFDIQEQDGEIYLLTELLEGQTLKELILNYKNAGKLFSSSEIEQLLTQLASALNYIHKLGVAHRDLTPSNIFVTNENNVKLIDFGLAEEDLLSNSTQYTKTITGSIDYLSPERVDGVSATLEGDYFALGIILYEMLTFTHPFKKDSEFKTLEAIKYLEPNISILNQNYSKYIDLAEGLLKKNRFERYSYLHILNFRTVRQKPKIKLSKNKKYFSIFILTLVILIISITFIFKNNKNEIIFIQKDTKNKITKSNFISNNKLSSLSCYLFYRQTEINLSMVFDPSAAKFLNEFTKEKFQETIIVINKFLKNIEPYKKGIFEACNEQPINDRIREYFLFFTNEIYKMNESNGSVDFDSLDSLKSKFKEDYKKIITEPYPGFFNQETQYIQIINYLDKNISYNEKNKLTFISHVELPKSLTLEQCSEIGSMLWISIFLNGSYNLKDIENINFIIYNPNHLSFESGKSNEYIVSKTNDNSFCHFKKTSFGTSEATIY